MSAGCTFCDLGATFRAKAPQWSHGVRWRGRLFWQRVFCWYGSVAFDENRAQREVLHVHLDQPGAVQTHFGVFRKRFSKHYEKSSQGLYLGILFEGLGACVGPADKLLRKMMLKQSTVAPSGFSVDFCLPAGTPNRDTAAQGRSSGDLAKRHILRKA